MQGPFTYEALPPSEISFVPLKQSRAFTAAELLQAGNVTLMLSWPDALINKDIASWHLKGGGP